MKIKAWGTRGSIAISNAASIKTGGNTTCFEIDSVCLPAGTHLMLDAGTGLVPAGLTYMPEIGKGLNYVIMFTHWHYDHIMGMTLAPPTFIDTVPMTIYGPVDHKVGPKEMIRSLFRRPYFPVDAKNIMHKMNFKPLEDFDVSVIVIHPKGGFTTLNRDAYTTIIKGEKQIPINGGKYPIGQCMIVTMARTNHGNATCISYRFHEMPSDKVFVLCTDHEDTVAESEAFRKHLAGADLLIMDGQYAHAHYMKKTGGFGHGTGYGVVKQAMHRAKRVGITHHDPGSNDQFLQDVILKEANAAFDAIKNQMDSGEPCLQKDGIFLVEDYATFEV